VNSVIVDASVGVKWLPLFAGEALIDRAKHLLRLLAVDEVSLIVPDLFWIEISSALCKAVRRGDCDPSEASQALVEVQGLALKTIPSTDLVNSAQNIAIQYGRSIYDSVYVALAKATRFELVTADEKLANAVAAYLPVKWLGAFE
jgi:predicted nucleic acid-binding protein